LLLLRHPLLRFVRPPLTNLQFLLVILYIFPAPAATAARDEYNKVQAKVDKMKKKVEEAEAFLNKDYGAENQFYKLSGQCFDITLKQYVYEICPYDSAKQKEGHSSTSLGRWGGFATNAQGAMTMKFEGGQTCWQGPARSLTAIMKCGAENKVLAVDEPSKCVYEMQFATPAVCNPQHAAVLRSNLAAQLSGEHDEL
jgi:protein kinase C substrate 80K-H